MLMPSPPQWWGRMPSCRSPAAGVGAAAAAHLGDERPQEHDRDDREADPGHRTADETADLAARELERAPALQLGQRAEDDADDERQDRQPEPAQRETDET